MNVVVGILDHRVRGKGLSRSRSNRARIPGFSAAPPLTKRPLKTFLSVWKAIVNEGDGR